LWDDCVYRPHLQFQLTKAEFEQLDLKIAWIARGIAGTAALCIYGKLSAQNQDQGVYQFSHCPSRYALQ
jgi:hypothetical protein